MILRIQTVRGASRAPFTIAVLAAAVMSFAVPSAADASCFIWTGAAADGKWTTPGNWTIDCGDDGKRYPSAAGDVASFVGPFQADQTIRIPIDVTVGEVQFNGDRKVSIVGEGGARLIIESGNTDPVRITTFRDPGTFELLAPMTLRSAVEVDIDQGSVLTMGSIAELGGARALTKQGRGQLKFRGPNTYTGTTTVQTGLLVLEGESGPSVSGDLVISPFLLLPGPLTAGAVLPVSAFVSVERPEQIADGARVRIERNGRLDVFGDDRMGALVVNAGGVVRVELLRTLAVTTLTMSGGTIDMATGASCLLDGGMSATSSGPQPALLNGPGILRLADGAHTITVLDGPAVSDLEISVGVIGGSKGGGIAQLTKDGAGVLRFTGTARNDYAGPTIVREGAMELARTGDGNKNGVSVPGALLIGGGAGAAEVDIVAGTGNIVDTADVVVAANGTLSTGEEIFETISTLTVDNGVVTLGTNSVVVVPTVTLTGQILLAPFTEFHLRTLQASPTPTGPSTILGRGNIIGPGDANLTVTITDGPPAIDFRVSVPIRLGGVNRKTLFKRGAGVMDLADVVANGSPRIEAGALLVTGPVEQGSIAVAGGRLGGTGKVGEVTVESGTIAPGLSPGRLRTGPVTFAAGSTYAAEIDGPTPGTDFDQLDVTGAVTLGSAALTVSVGRTSSGFDPLIIIANDGADPVNGTFNGLAEGATVRADAREFVISYRGGDGNDVALTNVTPLTYFLAEGATGTFFDEDVLIVNPNDADAPVTLTFLQEGGATIVQQRTVPAMSRLTINVDQVQGLAETTASVQVVSDNRLPLVVERTMFWDPQRYGGHTANAVTQPEKLWVFGEGAQGFFDTFILIANVNPTETTATLTFLREGESPVVKTMPVAPFARKTVFAGEFEELHDRTFGTVVETTLPVIAERAMYFGSVPGRNWSGGHVNIGAPEPSTSWFHAEGATGSFFETFILLSNPQDTAAEVDLQFLLEGGGVVTRHKTVGPKQRLTVNPAAEGDAQLAAGSVSTVVTSNVPIVSERSMYWQAEVTPWGEGHSSSGVVSTATRWGLAEGRVGRAVAYDTFILLANPSDQAAEVTINYLREGGGAPVVKTYSVAPKSRHTIDVGSTIPELRDSLFGARIDVTNGVPIAVERSMYWTVLGVHWAGGSNALGTALP